MDSAGVLVGTFLLALVLFIPGSVLAQSDDSDNSTPSPFDPCELVTSDEASSLAGSAFGDGVIVDNNTCVYGAQTLNVFTVTAAQASDSDTADAYWSQEEARVQKTMQDNVPNGISLNWTLTDVTPPAGADRAATVSGSATYLGRTISASAFYLLKGADFVGFSDLQAGNNAPSSDALMAEAATVVNRLP